MKRKQIYLASHTWAAIESEGIGLSTYVAFAVHEHRERIAKAREFVRRTGGDKLLVGSLLVIVEGFAERWAKSTATSVLRHRFRADMAQGTVREGLNTAFGAGVVEDAVEELTSTDLAFDQFCLVSRQHTVLKDDSMDWFASL